MNKQIILLICIGILLLVGLFVWFLPPLNSVSQSESKTLPLESRQNVACDLVQQPCSVVFPDMTIDVIFLKPPHYLQPFAAEVAVRGGNSATVKQVTLRFAMTGMQMALPETVLQQDTTSERQTTRWRNTVLIPICASGRHDWLALVTVTTPAKRYQAQYQLRMP